MNTFCLKSRIFLTEAHNVLIQFLQLGSFQFIINLEGRLAVAHFTALDIVEVKVA